MARSPLRLRIAPVGRLIVILSFECRRRRLARRRCLRCKTDMAFRNSPSVVHRGFKAVRSLSPGTRPLARDGCVERRGIPRGS
eukprot:2734614-Pyramimonas_sp.AAC.1